MKNKYTKFTCDEETCEKQIDDTKFPYDKGWKYIYHIELKKEKNKEIEKRDLHFCCKTCLIKYVRVMLNE